MPFGLSRRRSLLLAHDLGYFSATRHPWPCLLFLLPLLIAYEGGVLWVGGTEQELFRTGADTWLHWGLEACGLHHLYWAPALIVIVLLGWSWVRRYDRPYDAVGVCMGMAIESVVFALGLWGLSRALTPFLEGILTPVESLTTAEIPAGVGTALGSPTKADGPAVQIISFVGAGIYEEVLFRLLLFSALVWWLEQLDTRPLAAVVVAAVASSVTFSAAHHIGPYGEAFGGQVFVFRCLAGLYFSVLYQVRGFGVSVGAHACYDVLVGVMAA